MKPVFSSKGVWSAAEHLRAWGHVVRAGGCCSRAPCRFEALGDPTPFPVPKWLAARAQGLLTSRTAEQRRGTGEPEQQQEAPQ